MAILITGHRGFVGGHLTKYLDDNKISWVGFDLVEGNDIRDRYKLGSVFYENKIDTIIHLAALANPVKSQMFPDEYLKTNVQGTQNILECSKLYGVKHLIFFSSSCVYGNQTPPNNELQPYDPQSVYAISKVAGEMLVRASDVPYTIIRPFTLYGMNGRKDQVVYKWINMLKDGKPITIYGDGTTKRGYTNIDYLVKTVVGLTPMNETFNLGGTEVITVYELADIFQKVLKCEINKVPEIQYLPLLKGDTYNNSADITKAKEMLGYNPPEEFEKNITEIIKHELCQ
jgi:UDP-glucuronate 4-epimerase